MKILHTILTVLVLFSSSVSATEKDYYEFLKPAYDDKTYADIIENLADLIGSPPTKDQTDLYFKLLDKNSSFQVIEFRPNTIYYHGPIDYLKNISVEKIKKNENLTKNYNISWEYGRGKVYAATIIVPYSSISVEKSYYRTKEKHFEINGHYEFITHYLNTNGWILENPIVSFFSGNYIYSKGNIELYISKTIDSPLTIIVKRKDLVFQNSELESIHNEGLIIEQEFKQKDIDAKFEAKFKS